MPTPRRRARKAAAAAEAARLEAERQAAAARAAEQQRQQEQAAREEAERQQAELEEEAKASRDQLVQANARQVFTGLESLSLPILTTRETMLPEPRTRRSRRAIGRARW